MYQWPSGPCRELFSLGQTGIVNRFTLVPGLGADCETFQMAEPWTPCPPPTKHAEQREMIVLIA